MCIRDSYTEDEKGELVSGNRERKVQTKYNTELVYIQDVSKLADGATAAVSYTHLPGFL